MGEYMQFAVGEEHFIMDVTKVREVCQLDKPVRVPQVPPYLLGLVSLRGQVIPVMDLGLRLGIHDEDMDCQQIIVVEVEHQDGVWLMGVLVEAILGLEEAAEGDIGPAPRLPKGAGRFVSGIFKKNGYLLLEPNTLCIWDTLAAGERAG